MTDIVLFILLLAAHVLGDFVLQTGRAVEAKRRLHWPTFARHVGGHVLLAYLLLGAWTLWQIPLLIALTHAAIDFVKMQLEHRRSGMLPADSTRGKLMLLAFDQIAHLAVLFALARWAASLRPPGGFFWLDRFVSLPAIAVVVIGLVLTIQVGAIVIGILIEPYLAQLDRKSTPAGDPSRESGLRPQVGAEPRGFVGGGRIIGQLERALVFLLVTTGNLAGVGFLVAAKSIFRFGELKDHQQRKEAEYILIGTLMSFTWSIFAAWLTLYALLELNQRW